MRYVFVSFVAILLFSSVYGESFRGKVSVHYGGTAGNTVFFTTDDGRSLRLAGDLLPELARLSGVELLVWGTSSHKVFSVTRYRILAVNGEAPYVGELLFKDGTLSLRPLGFPREIELEGVLVRKMIKDAPKRVWLLGDFFVEGNKLKIHVKKVGYIR